MRRETGFKIYFTPVSLEETPENSHPGDPQSLLAGPGVLGSLPLAEAAVAALAAGLVVGPNTRARVNSHGLLDHQAVLDQLPDVLPGVRVGDFVDFIRVKPNL